jgi:sugar phosphate isomerase/epimerase
MEEQTRKITGTFLQLDEVNLQYPKAKWDEEFRIMKEMGMDTVAIQYWGSPNKVVDYPSNIFPRSKYTHIADWMFELAEKYGIKLFIGILLIDGWWTASKEPVYFDKALPLQIQVIDELQSFYGKYPSFYGWYITEELDDLNWKTPESQANVIAFFKKLVAHCKEVSGNKPVLTAPFIGWNTGSNLHMTEEAFEQLWTDFFRETDIDIISLQDASIRAKYHEQVLTPYFRALQRAAKKTGKEAWSDLETFEQIEGWPFDANPFKAVPARFDRILKQMEIESPFVDKIITFEFHHYMCPLHGEEKARLYQEYMDWVKKQPE